MRGGIRPRDRIRVAHVLTVSMSIVFIRGQLGFMRRRGIDVHVITSPGPELTEIQNEPGVTAHAVPMTRAITPVRDAVSLFRLVRTLQRVRPTIVHAHTPKGGLLGMVAARLANVPVRVYHMRGLPLMGTTGLRRWLLTWSERVSCALADQVVCVSRSLRDVAIEEGLCRPDRIVVLANGSGQGVNAAGRFNPDRVGAETRHVARASLDIPSNVPVLGFVGRLVRDKGIVELFEAWRWLRDHWPDLHLLLVGPVESGDPVPARVLESLREDPRVRIAGPRRDMPAMYAAMDIVVLPSYREGFPNSPLEAAAMGLPVIATRIPGCVDAVVDGETGSLIPVRDAHALAAAVHRYLGDESLRRQHGRNGRERVLRDFRPETIWSEVYRVYADLLRRRGYVPLPAHGRMTGAKVHPRTSP